ncbi:MAG: peptidoglycan bridge formation glycyltransferase FemA/FemB family protein [Spirochaetales bacterium]|nr:peptidoglycan bridge formation glycyltransferase FemA/FemB family protein [Spirochaetales bacterium]
MRHSLLMNPMEIHIERISEPIQCIEDRPGGSFLQSRLWGLFKARTGWESYICKASGGSLPAETEMLVLRRRLAGSASFLYIPFGFSCLEHVQDREHLVAEVLMQTGTALGNRDLFIRFDVPWQISPSKTIALHTGDMQTEASRMRQAGLHPGIAVQVPDTVILDLAPEESALLAGMKPKWRYNIRLAEKKGVQVEEAGKQGLDTFMSLYRETAVRDRIAIHPASYYEKLFDTVYEVANLMLQKGIPEHALPRISLLLAKHESRALAGIIVFFFGKEAVYLYGASSSEKRNLMPAYALQWHAIRMARSLGCAYYDFFGIPPDGDDRNHPMAGLYRFKTGFGGSIMRRMGAWDFPLRRPGYFLFHSAEIIRQIWHKRIRKKIAMISMHSSHAQSDADSENTSPSKA